MNIKYLISKLLKKMHLPAIKNSVIHNTSKVASASHVLNTTLDKYSYIGNNCTVIETDIGSFCSIADNVILGGASHPINWVSTSPVFHHGKNIMKQNFSKHAFNTAKRTIVEHDVWIGNNCLIKSGVVIHTGAIIGMGSIVTKDIPPYEIWAGNPAKLIRKRFDLITTKHLLSMEWWNMNDSQLKNISVFMHNPHEFIKQYKDEAEKV